MRNLRTQQVGENWILIDADTGALVTGAVRDGDGLRFNERSAVRRERDLLAFIEGYEAAYGPDGEVDPGLTHEVRSGLDHLYAVDQAAVNRFVRKDLGPEPERPENAERHRRFAQGASFAASEAVVEMNRKRFSEINSPMMHRF